LNVIINPRTSWMSREALLAPLLLGSAALMLAGVDAAGWVAAASALAFLVCQANILRAARGIAAWREPLTALLIVVSGLAEGMALYAAVTALWGRASPAICLALAVLLALRLLCGIAWRRRLVRVLRGPGLEALDRLRVASLIAAPLPLFVVLVALPLPLAPGGIDALQLLAAAFAVGGGAAFKLALITRVAFNQGFALPHLPVRGVRR
jgi:phenylacetyl-CoA:acceptor oxidoreductase subunit 2